ncbi:MAG: nucleoside deaminase [Lewinellaceae bacterium]|nr:nucleoside deaminase [Lewinellaceae bacterium]
MQASSSDRQFLERAIALAYEGMRKGAGGPFGAVVVKDGQIIGEGHNEVLATNDPTAHAEMVAIRQACGVLKDFQLENCTIYCSSEPCPMCMGAIYWARPTRIVFATSHHDAAEHAQFDDRFIYEELKLPHEVRKIPAIQLLREEGLKLFAEWRGMDGRRGY